MIPTASRSPSTGSGGRDPPDQPRSDLRDSRARRWRTGNGISTRCWPSSPTISRATAWSSSPERRSRRSNGWDGSTRSTTRSSRRCTTAPATRLAAEGFEQYEISNWARPGEACLHNLVYWEAGDWLAIGPAAAGNLGGIRYRNLPRLDDWLQGSGLSSVVNVDEPSASVANGERLMLGLRLRRGIERSVFEGLVRGHAERAAAVSRHLERENLVWQEDRLRIADGSVMLADEILSDLL